MTEKRTVRPNEDPVCGMTVSPTTARTKNLTITYDGVEYVFCGKGCLLEFQDHPARHLAVGYKPTM